MGNLITKYEEFIFEADSPSTILSAARLEVSKVQELNIYLKDTFDRKTLSAGSNKAKKIQAEIEFLTSKIDFYQKFIPALTKLKSAIDGKLAEVKENSIIRYEEFIFEVEKASTLVNSAKLNQSKVNDEFALVSKKYKEDKAAAAGDESKQLKIESEYLPKRIGYYQKMVSTSNEIKSALEAELSELSQA
jgi:transcription elongation factor Elf1